MKFVFLHFQEQGKQFRKHFDLMPMQLSSQNVRQRFISSLYWNLYEEDFPCVFFALNKVPHAALHAYRIHNFNSDAFAHQILPFHWISFLMKSPRHFLRFCSSQSIKWHEINSETKLLLAKINSNFKVRQTNFSFCS